MKYEIFVTDVAVYPVKHKTLKANCNIVLNDVFVITGVKVIKGKNGLFVTMPQYKNSDGDYKDLVYPINVDLRKDINDIVLEAYENR